MGVPAFFRWLCEKYPKIIKDVLEMQEEVDGVPVPIDLAAPNPNGLEFDNLYLDMNGIIHPCFHPEGKPQPTTESEIMLAIFLYIDRIFSIVRPRKLLYMAIDGVAPRAKMNQQRSRRFKAAKERREKEQKEEELRKQLMSEGREVPPKKEAAFDSNIITPGTAFMAKVAEALRYYVRERMATDAGWKGVKVILSDATVPGEGEHKLMEYIRYQKAQQGYDANTRHVVYGLDADLIMLGLATHEPHFYILREVVNINNSNNCYICGQPGHFASECKGKPKEKQDEFDAKDVAKKPYQFLCVSVLREYLEHDLRPFNQMPFDYDMERAIDDFVFLCFFVGNDFLPHLPTLEIREKAIDLLVDLYKQILPTLGGYITENGEVNLGRAKVLLHEVGKLEDSILVNRRQREQRRKEGRRKARLRQKRQNEYLEQELKEQPRGKRARFSEDDSPSSESVRQGRRKAQKEETQEESARANFLAAQKLKAELFGDQFSPDDKEKEKEKETEKDKEREQPIAVRSITEDDSEQEPPDDVRLGDHGWKERYYKLKFHVGLDDVEFKKRVATSYAEGLVWVLRYYYQGCCSWNWFYPYHYSPFAEEMDLLDPVTPHLERGEPFKPFSQLMGVLPASSGVCLPPACREMMTRPDSDIIDFYPEDFEEDFNGKKFAWQAVALLPFIEEDRLLRVMEKLEDTYTEEEKERNSHGKDVLFVHSSHPSAATFDILYSENDVSRVELDPQKAQGMRGSLTRDPKTVPIGDSLLPPPFVIQEHMRSLTNSVYSAVYHLPPVSEGHIFSAELLPGAILPPPVLTPEDFRTRRPMRMDVHATGRFINNRIARGRDSHGHPHYQPYDRHRGHRSSYPPSDRMGYREERDYGHGQRATPPPRRMHQGGENAPMPQYHPYQGQQQRHSQSQQVPYSPAPPYGVSGGYAHGGPPAPTQYPPPAGGGYHPYPVPMPFVSQPYPSVPMSMPMAMPRPVPSVAPTAPTPAFPAGTPSLPIPPTPTPSAASGDTMRLLNQLQQLVQLNAQLSNWNPPRSQ